MRAAGAFLSGNKRTRIKTFESNQSGTDDEDLVTWMCNAGSSGMVESKSCFPDHRPRLDSGESMEDLKPTKTTASDDVTNCPRIREGFGEDSPRSPGMVSTKSQRAIDEYLEHGHGNGMGGFDQTLVAGDEVTADTAKQNLVVVRGSHWNWGDDDGGEGRPGIILTYDKKTKLATVFWHDTGIVRSGYRLGPRSKDLAKVRAKGANKQEMLKELREEPSSPKMPAKRLASGLRSKANFFMSKLGGNSSMVSRDSQDAFDAQDQTVIIFDWDDTLFPTTYCFEAARGPKLKMKSIPMQSHLTKDVKSEVGRQLMRTVVRLEQLLRKSHSLAHVVIVTLASPGWVVDTCKYFLPGIDTLLEELKIEVIYAKELLAPEEKEFVDDGGAAMSTPEGRIFWSQLKGRAVKQAVDSFYSSYEGQSWKNIVSIGDANFERLGTMLAAAEYRKQSGVLEDGCCNSAGHLIKVRTKTFKMIDEPSVHDLESQQNLLLRWIPLMVRLDGNFDASLNDADDVQEIRSIASRLTNGGDTASAIQREEQKRGSLPATLGKWGGQLDDDEVDRITRTWSANSYGDNS